MSQAKAKTAEIVAEKPLSEVKNDDAPNAAQKDDSASKPLKKYEVGRKLSSFTRKLSAYTRMKARILATLNDDKPEKEDPSSEDKAEAEADKKPLSKVLQCYRLIRNFVITYNWLILDYPARRDGMFYFPEVFEPELKKLLA